MNVTRQAAYHVQVRTQMCAEQLLEMIFQFSTLLDQREHGEFARVKQTHSSL